MSILMGFSFFATKIALEMCHQEVILAWRFTLAFACMVILKMVGVIHSNFKGKSLLILVLISMIYPVLSFFLETKGVNILPTSQAGVIMSLMPIIALVLGMIFLKEQPNITQTVMLVLSVIGVGIITLSSNKSDIRGNAVGIMLLVGTASCGAVQTVMVRKMAATFSSVEITFFMNFIAAIIYHINVLFVYGKSGMRMLMMPTDNLKCVLALLYLGVGCSVVGFFCMNYVNSNLEAARAAVFTNLATVVSILAGVLIGKDQIGLIQLVGMIFIIFSVWGVNWFAQSDRRIGSQSANCDGSSH